MIPDLTRREFVTTTGALVAGAVAPFPMTHSPHPAPADSTVVLFQGDSITDAGRDRSAANPNEARALGSGYPLLVAAAALAAHPERDLRFYNRGVSGNKVPDLAARWAAETVALAPAVLSILIGVNDFWHKLGQGYTGTVQDYETQYTALLDETRRALPAVRVLVLEPFVLRCGAVDARWFPEFDERRAAARRVAERARATFIPLQSVFDDLARKSTPQYWAGDGVHPTPAGHGVIAGEWRRVAQL
ncbi:MAG TPA: GDSL-type esterase/lipase family protein [Gemmatimonadales bacterium]|nr:GDSL-type esterase/lipase family protein [Gemmatimonadales bacterium]